MPSRPRYRDRYYTPFKGKSINRYYVANLVAKMLERMTGDPCTVRAVTDGANLVIRKTSPDRWEIN